MEARLTSSLQVAIIHCNSALFSYPCPFFSRQIFAVLAAAVTICLGIVCLIDMHYSRPMEMPLREAAHAARRAGVRGPWDAVAAGELHDD